MYQEVEENQTPLEADSQALKTLAPGRTKGSTESSIVLVIGRDLAHSVMQL